MLGLPPISRVIAARLVSTIAPNRAIVVQVLDGVAIDVLKHILHLPWRRSSLARQQRCLAVRFGDAILAETTRIADEEHRGRTTLSSIIVSRNLFLDDQQSFDPWTESVNGILFIPNVKVVEAMLKGVVRETLAHLSGIAVRGGETSIIVSFRPTKIGDRVASSRDITREPLGIIRKAVGVVRGIMRAKDRNGMEPRSSATQLVLIGVTRLVVRSWGTRLKVIYKVVFADVTHLHLTWMVSESSADVKRLCWARILSFVTEHKENISIVMRHFHRLVSVVRMDMGKRDRVIVAMLMDYLFPNGEGHDRILQV